MFSHGECKPYKCQKRLAFLDADDHTYGYTLKNFCRRGTSRRLTMTLDQNHSHLMVEWIWRFLVKEPLRRRRFM